MTTTTPRTAAEGPAVTPTCGFAVGSGARWLEHVQEDQRRVRVRLEYLRAEQSRLENQQRLGAELLAVSAAG